MAEEEIDPSELFSSPIKPSELPSRPKTPRTPKTPTPNPNPSHANKDKEPFDAEEVREAALRRELEGVRNINEVIEGVIGTLERARGNMGVCVFIYSPFFLFSLPCRTIQKSSKIQHIFCTQQSANTGLLSPATERLPDSDECLHSAQHLDAHPLADRA